MRRATIRVSMGCLAWVLAGWSAWAQAPIPDAATEPTIPKRPEPIPSGNEPNSPFVSIAAGFYHTCALTQGGALLCWGKDGRDWVRDGHRYITDCRRVPTLVDGLTSGVAMVSSGAMHTCAVNSMGRAMCWGANRHGQLGAGISSWQEGFQREVSGLTGVVQISAGQFHTCAVTSRGAALCWGLNRFGALGTGTTQMQRLPTPVAGLTSGVVAISAGSFHTCAVTTSGGVLCWGYNRSGALGDGTTIRRLVPTQVSGLATGVVAI